MRSLRLHVEWHITGVPKRYMMVPNILHWGLRHFSLFFFIWSGILSRYASIINLNRYKLYKLIRSSLCYTDLNIYVNGEPKCIARTWDRPKKVFELSHTVYNVRLVWTHFRTFDNTWLREAYKYTRIYKHIQIYKYSIIYTFIYRHIICILYYYIHTQTI